MRTRVIAVLSMLAARYPSDPPAAVRTTQGAIDSARLALAVKYLARRCA